MDTAPVLEANAATNGLYTADDLLTMPDGDHYELVDGRLKETNVGQESSWVSTALLARMFHHCAANKAGWVQGPEAGYQCFPGRPNLVRRPDLSFVRFDRYPEERLPRGHSRIAPDLATAVVSPNDFAEEVMEKVVNYLAAGVRLIWVIYPIARTAMVYRLNGSVGQVTADQELSGDEVVSGFSCPLRDILLPAPAAG